MRLTWTCNGLRFYTGHPPKGTRRLQSKRLIYGGTHTQYSGKDGNMGTETSELYAAARHPVVSLSLRRRMGTSTENSARCAQKSVILADEVSHICERSEGVLGRRSNVVALSLGRGLLSSASGFVSARHNWDK